MENENITRLNYEDKEIYLIGTAHVSQESADLVEQVINEQKPDTVCVELCKSRYQSITQKDQWKNQNLLKVIKEKKAFLLLSNLMLAHFQKKIGKKLGIKPGEEMLRALKAADTVNAEISLADRDVRTTLSRTWRFMGFWTKIKLFAQFILSVGDIDEIKEEDIEKMKKEDFLESLLSEIGKSLPEVRQILIDERDKYLAYKIRTAPGPKIVAAVGAGHVPGIKKNWEKEIDIAELEKLPPKGKVISSLKWVIPILILALIITGFFYAGTTAGTHMVKWWVLTNAAFAGLGALAAFAHPLTILTAFVASPLTSLNPIGIENRF